MWKRLIYNAIVPPWWKEGSDTCGVEYHVVELGDMEKHPITTPQNIFKGVMRTMRDNTMSLCPECLQVCRLWNANVERENDTIWYCEKENWVQIKCAISIIIG